MKKFFNKEDIEKLSVTSKIGLISTISPEGEVQITLISSIQPRNESELIWGEFSSGLSKKYLKDNPKCGFLALNPEKEWWSGKALLKDTKDQGTEFDMFNNQPLFRYNSYFGIGKVHYMDVIDFSGKQNLPMKDIVVGALSGNVIKGFVKGSEDKAQKIKGLSLKLAKDIAAPKFISYVDEDGYPVIFPVVQAVLKDDMGRVLIPLTANKEKLGKINPGSKAALFYANLKLSSVLFQGVYVGVEKKLGITYAIFDTYKVYNSMVPIPGYIYPLSEYQLVH